MKQVIALIVATLALSTSAVAGDLGLIALNPSDVELAKQLSASDFMTPELSDSMADLSNSIGEEQKALAEALAAKAAYDAQMAEMQALLRDQAPMLRKLLAEEQNANPKVSALLDGMQPRLNALKTAPAKTAPAKTAPGRSLAVVDRVHAQRADPTGRSLYDSLTYDNE